MHRGAGELLQDTLDIESQVDQEAVKSKLRYVAIYGTAPSQLVDADSKLARCLFGHFDTVSRKNGGHIKVPEDIRTFTGHDGKVEPLFLGDPTQLYWDEVETIEGKIRYRGFVLFGKKHGRGQMIYPDGSIYRGIWKDDMRDGKGTLVFINRSVFEGQWSKDMREGKGRLDFANGDSYDGEWVKDLYDGQGVFKSGVNIYEGELREGK